MTNVPTFTVLERTFSQTWALPCLLLPFMQIVWVLFSQCHAIAGPKVGEVGGLHLLQNWINPVMYPVT